MRRQAIVNLEKPRGVMLNEHRKKNSCNTYYDTSIQ